MLLHSRELLFVIVCGLFIKKGFLQHTVGEIVENIQSKRYDLAEEQILRLKNNSKIAEIIHNIYQNNENSSHIILLFESQLTRVDLSFHVLKALRNEMIANKDMDPLYLIHLAKSLENDVVYQENNDPIIKAESKKIIDEIKIDVKNSATSILTEALLNNNFTGNNKIEKVVEGIFNFFYDLNHEILREMVNRTYTRVPALEIVKAILISSQYIPQHVAVILAVFEKLEKDNDLNNDAVLEIAYHIGMIRKEKNYRNLFPHIKYEVNLMIDKLPTCARNLYFVDEICLWNRGKGEYLYRDGSQNNFPKKMALTNVPQSLKVGEAAWIVDRTLKSFSLRSQLYKKEYLTVSQQTFNSLAHYVEYSEMDENNNNNSNTWVIELEGDYCFIKNQHVEEYLIVSDAVNQNNRPFVLIAPTKAVKQIGKQAFQWQIRNCS